MDSSVPPIPRLNVRMKILLIFLTLSIISLLVTGFFAFYTISDIGDSAQKSSVLLGWEAVRDSSAALQDSTEEYMVQVASDQAKLIDVLFLDTESELDILAAQALSVENNPSYVSRTKSYTRKNPPPDPYAGTVVILAPGASATENSEEYHALSGMDDSLMAVYQADGDLAAIYVATDSGIMHSYPWDGYTAGDYDPRNRTWFTLAKSSIGPVWTDPYVDAAGRGLMVTCSRSVKTRYGTWVIATDLTVDQLNTYTSMTLGGKGYSVLLDNQGNVISRPGMSANGTRWDQPFVTENAFQSQNPGLKSIGHNMTAGMAGLERIQFNGNEIFIAYAPVRSVNWSYAVSLPASEIVAPILITEGRIATSTHETTSRIQQQTDRLLYIFAGLFILLLLIVIILSWLLARMITRPIDTLREGTAVIGSGDLDFRLNIQSGDEFEALAGSFNKMAADLRLNIENLRRTTAEKERYTKELEIAKEIQDTFLPESVPAIPGFEVAATTIPAMEIGGDLYDFIPAPEGSTGFVIADVSGKGVSAALYMALCRTLLHASGEADPDPSRVIRNANRLIYEDGRSSMFITVFYGLLNPESMTFSYVNAGHNPPLLLRNGEAATWMAGVRGIALGVVPDVSIAATVLELRHGDLLVLYTDGVTEAFNEQQVDFGEEQLRDCISRNQKRPAQDILEALLGEIRAFSGTAPQSDDITLVVIRVL
jgi:phosphoserine phosphatase RsbU/P